MFSLKIVCELLVLVAILKFGACRNGRLEYYTNPHKEVTIKMKFHIDLPLIRKLHTLPEYGKQTKRNLKSLSKKVLSEVETLFNHSTINQRIKFEILDTKFLKSNTKMLPMDENASKYLKSYCNWQSKKKVRQWYYSVLLTGLDLFYINAAGKEVRKSTGRSYMTGMCSIRNSCTVIEWHPTNVGYLLAHEIAHSLGVTHDGAPHNKCAAKGYMMGAKYKTKAHPNSWSSCSRQALNTYLRSERAWCLQPEY